MMDYVFCPEEFSKAFSYITNEQLRIVSLTITEKGYCQNVDGNLDLDNPLIVKDLSLMRNEVGK